MTEKKGESIFASKNAIPEEKKCVIYALKLEKNNYYVGKTNRKVEERFSEHKNGEGSEWTKMYNPIEILESVVGDKWLEDAWTMRYMEKYGMDSVRGGPYVQLELPDEQVKEILRRLRMAFDSCAKCGKTNHMISSCPKGKSKEKEYCVRCSREGHSIKECFALYYPDGQLIISEDD